MIPFEKVYIILIYILDSIDTADNYRDNLISYHDVIPTERWEMRFLGFILGIREANVYSCYKTFHEDGDKMEHPQFRDTMTFQLLKHCESLVSDTSVSNSNDQGNFKNGDIHVLEDVPNPTGVKRKRAVCTQCSLKGISGTRASKCCSCNKVPTCKNCYYLNLIEIGQRNQSY